MADESTAVLVMGDDPIAAANVALGVTLAQAARRRVLIVDLVGELPPLRRLLSVEDPHGISDCFVYGISLDRVAQPITGVANAFVVPSGTDDVASDSILRHPRWHRLVTRLRTEDALLVLVVRSGTPGIETLLEATDGVIAVGEPDASTAHRILAAVEAADAAEEPKRFAGGRRGPPYRERSRYLLPALGGTALVLGWAWLGWMLLGADQLSPPEMRSEAGGLAPAEGSEAGPPILAQRLERAAEPMASFGVEVVITNTRAGAISNLQGELGGLPAATYAPVVLADGVRWFKVIVGAFSEKAGADSMLRDLRRRRLVQSGAGTVVLVPFTLLVEEDISRETAPGLVSAYAARGLPVYALVQADGSARLFAGAFESAEQASILAASLRASGLAPVITQRTGRAF